LEKYPTTFSYHQKKERRGTGFPLCTMILELGLMGTEQRGKMLEENSINPAVKGILNSHRRFGSHTKDQKTAGFILSPTISLPGFSDRDPPDGKEGYTCVGGNYSSSQR